MVFIFLCVIGFLGRLSYEMARSPLSPLFALHLGASTQLVGLIVAAVTITGIFVKLPAGILADRFGFRSVMLSGAVVKSSAPFLYLLVTSWPWLLVLRFYHGFATALYAPAASAFVAKSYPNERARRLGLYSSAENAGVVLGPIVGAAVLAATSFHWAFVVSGLIGTAALLVVLYIPRIAFGSDQVEREKQNKTEIHPHFATGIRQIIHDPIIRHVSLVEATIYMGVGVLQAYLPLYALSVHIRILDIGILFGAQGIASIVSRPFMGSLSDRIGREPLITGGVILVATSLMFMPYTASLSLLVVLNMLFGLGTGMVTPSTSATIGDRVKQGNYGAAMGVFGSLWDKGHASGPIIVGYLIPHLGYRNAFLIISIAIGVALLIFLVGFRRVKMPGT